MKPTFLSQCRLIFKENIRPCSVGIYEKNEYKILKEIVIGFVNKSKIADFVFYFQEYQYNVNLWAAHFVIEIEGFDIETKKEAFSIIKRYSKTPLDLNLASEERNWLAKNKVLVNQIMEPDVADM